jgi:hypothetical protein
MQVLRTPSMEIKAGVLRTRTALRLRYDTVPRRRGGSSVGALCAIGEYFLSGQDGERQCETPWKDVCKTSGNPVH